MTVFIIPAFFATLALHWIPQASNSAAGLRGLSVVSQKVAWTSGTKGTILRTLDGGEHWEARTVPGTDGLDFRDVKAFDARTALVMASGAGEASRVYLTTDGGEIWMLVLSNPDKAGFFDAMKFWDRKHGILLGDPVAGHFTIYTTEDAGLNWERSHGPEAIADEGAFAASGTCLTLLGNHDAWFGTGGPGAGRVFHTTDRSKNWTVAATPLSGHVASAGIFSVVFVDSKHGIAVGGDYQKPAQAEHTIAMTGDGGFTWVVPAGALAGGFRSGATYVKPRKMLLAVGTGGSDYSFDGGMTWRRLSTDNLNAVASDGESVWAVGPKGLIVKLAFHE
jgi:photosystem II stability/assembly factor-like uncharacterized protein